jgi:hypothetical protein
MGCPHAQRQSDEFFCPRCDLRWPCEEGSDCRKAERREGARRRQVLSPIRLLRQKTTKVLERTVRSLTGHPSFLKE